MIFADVNVNQLKELTKATSSILSYINNSKIILYYVNQGPVIFRVILKRNKNSEVLLFSLPRRIELRSELGINPDAEDIKNEVDKRINVGFDARKIKRV